MINAGFIPENMYRLITIRKSVGLEHLKEKNRHLERKQLISGMGHGEQRTTNGELGTWGTGSREQGRDNGQWETEN